MSASACKSLISKPILIGRESLISKPILIGRGNGIKPILFTLVVTFVLVYKFVFLLQKALFF